MANSNVNRIQRNIVLLTVLGVLVASLGVTLVGVLPLYNQLRSSATHTLINIRDDKTLLVEEYLTRLIDLSIQISNNTQSRIALAEYNRGAMQRNDIMVRNGTRLLDVVRDSKDIRGVTQLDENGDQAVQVGRTIPQEYWPIPAADTRYVRNQ